VIAGAEIWPAASVRDRLRICLMLYEGHNALEFVLDEGAVTVANESASPQLTMKVSALLARQGCHEYLPRRG
jgi:hypothetical protein